MSKTPRQIIRRSLPLKDIEPELAAKLVEDCFQGYAREGRNRRNLDVHIKTYIIRMREAMKP